MIKCVDKDYGPKPFRSIDAWLLETGFSGMVEEEWRSYEGQGSVLNVLKDKLKLLKVDLKIWNKDVFGNLNSSKQSLLQDMENLDF